MITTHELVFSNAELTLMTFMLDKEIFPATPPPTLDDDGWKAVERGLVARGAVHGRFRQQVADEVAAVLDVVLSADRSLWTTQTFAPGEGTTRGYILWLKGDDVVRQSAPAVGPQHLVSCGLSGIDEMLATVIDFPTAAGAEPRPPVTMPIGDFAEAAQVASRESPAAAAERYPAASGYLVAVADARYAATLESRRDIGDGLQRREMLSFAESRAHGLWLARDDPYTNDNLTDEQTRLQRVSIDMARDEATAVANGPG